MLPMGGRIPGGLFAEDESRQCANYQMIPGFANLFFLKI